MENYIEQAIGAMLMAKVITFKANSWAFGFVDMVVKSTVFTEPEFIVSVAETDWNNGPAASVAKLLTELVLEKQIQFLPVQEETAEGGEK